MLYHRRINRPLGNDPGPGVASGAEKAGKVDFEHEPGEIQSTPRNYPLIMTVT